MSRTSFEPGRHKGAELSALRDTAQPCQHPEARDAAVSIRLDCVEAPGELERGALQQIATTLEARGIQFVIAVLPPDSR